MLAQTLVPPVGQQQPQQSPYQQAMQNPQQFQSQQQIPQLPPNGINPNLQPEILQLIMRLPAAQREPLLAKHNGNVNSALQELVHQHNQRQQGQQQGVHSQAQGSGGDAQSRMPQAVSINGINQQSGQQQQPGRSGLGHQRSESQQMLTQNGQGQNSMQGGQGQGVPGLNFDPKQFEAVSLEKKKMLGIVAYGSAPTDERTATTSIWSHHPSDGLW